MIVSSKVDFSLYKSIEGSLTQVFCSVILHFKFEMHTDLDLYLDRFNQSHIRKIDLYFVFC